MMRSWSTGIAALGLVASAASCDGTSKAIDPFPIQIDLTTGPVILKAEEGSKGEFDIVVDVLSPITVLDSYRAGDVIQDPLRRLVELTLYGTSDPPIPRFQFRGVTAYDLHSCYPSEALCLAGEAENSREVYGILGSNLLSRSSVRFDFSGSEMRFFPDTAGTDSERTLACDAVFGSPFAGGGTLLINGSEVRFGALRPTLGVCMHTEVVGELGLQADTSVEEFGTDVQMAISTAIGPSLLTEEAYVRYAASGDAPAIETLEPATVYLPSGPVQGKLAEVPFLALTGDIGGDSNGRGPCRELYANARMREIRSCAMDPVNCPCPEDRETCKAAAAVELGLTVRILVVQSGLPLLQALRDELRPQVPELDGVLGVEALRSLQVEFDFPNKRILMRCKDLGTCITRPQVRNQINLTRLEECSRAEADIRADQGADAGVIP
ncbi:MAG: hypothetical protein GY811_27380 [Myxococcales bacterium]|nr:hypothetical protein [Myxococcales bacterium]